MCSPPISRGVESSNLTFNLLAFDLRLTCKLNAEITQNKSAQKLLPNFGVDFRVSGVGGGRHPPPLGGLGEGGQQACLPSLEK